MILTKHAFNIGLLVPLNERLKEYKKWRNSKNPWSPYVSFICCYGKALEDYREKLI